MNRAALLLLSLALACHGTDPTTAPDDSGAAPTDTAPTNAAPSAPAVSITPAIPADTADLVCTFTAATDPDGDPLAYGITWLVDGAAWSGTAATRGVPGDTVPASATRQGEVWTCEISAFDGVTSTIGSAVVVIATWPADDRTVHACEATGSAGPDQVACDAAYAGGPLEGLVTVNEGFQRWTVPATGEYWLTAAGAQGAAANPAYAGGRGAVVSGPLALEAGSVLTIAIGQQGLGSGSEQNGGGGGGTWVALDDTVILVAAGGGGARRESEMDGCGGNAGPDGTVGSGMDPTSTCEPWPGSPGAPGAVSSSTWGSGGAGILADGESDGYYGYWLGSGGETWENGLRGGVCVNEYRVPADGGFGGGGAGCGDSGGGGGGGYSGGGGGFIAGGGGSFGTAAVLYSQSGINPGDGWLYINLHADE